MSYEKLLAGSEPVGAGRRPVQAEVEIKGQGVQSLDSLGAKFHSDEDVQNNALYDEPIFLQYVPKCPGDLRTSQQKQAHWRNYQAIPWIDKALTQGFKGNPGLTASEAIKQSRALFQEILLQTIMIVGFPLRPFQQAPEIDIFGKEGSFGLTESEIVRSRALHVFHERKKDQQIVAAYCAPAVATREPHQAVAWNGGCDRVDVEDEFSASGGVARAALGGGARRGLSGGELEEECAQERWSRAELEDKLKKAAGREMCSMIKHLDSEAKESDDLANLRELLATLLLEQVSKKTIKFNQLDGNNILSRASEETQAKLRAPVKTMLEKVVSRYVLAICKKQLPEALSIKLGFLGIGEHDDPREEEKARINLKDAWVEPKKSPGLEPSEIQRCAIERQYVITYRLKEKAGPQYLDCLILDKQIEFLFWWREQKAAIASYLSVMWQACTGCCCSDGMSKVLGDAGYNFRIGLWRLFEAVVLGPFTQNSVGKLLGDSHELNKFKERELNADEVCSLSWTLNLIKKHLFLSSLLLNFMIVYPLAMAMSSSSAAWCSLIPAILCIFSDGLNPFEVFRPPRLNGLDLDHKTLEARRLLTNHRIFSVWTLSLCAFFLIKGVGFAQNEAFFSALVCYVFSSGVILSNVVNNSIGLTFWNTTNRYRDEYLSSFLGVSACVWTFGLMTTYFSEIDQYFSKVYQYYLKTFPMYKPAKIQELSTTACEHAYPIMFALYKDPAAQKVFTTFAAAIFLWCLDDLYRSFNYIKKHRELSKDRQEVADYATSFYEIEKKRMSKDIVQSEESCVAHSSTMTAMYNKYRVNVLFSLLGFSACIAFAVRFSHAEDFYQDKLAELGGGTVENLLVVNKAGYAEYLNSWAFRGKQVVPAAATAIIFLACAKSVCQGYFTRKHFMDSRTLKKETERNKGLLKNALFSQTSPSQAGAAAASASASGLQHGYHLHDSV